MIHRTDEEIEQDVDTHIDIRMALEFQEPEADCDDVAYSFDEED